MANQTPLATWLYSKRTELNARFREFNWPKQVCPGVFDFETKISFDGIEAEGRGVDTRREIALEKSVSEAIERLICKTLQFDSVGFAVAGNFDPTEHARFEALERFYLNEHLEKSLSLVKLNFAFPDVLKLKSHTQTSEVAFYRMQTPINFFGVVCRIQSKDSKQTSWGFALSENVDKSVRRSFFEALPSFAWLASDEKLEMSELPWHLQPSFCQRIQVLLSDANDFQATKELLPNLKSVAVALEPISILKDAALKLARFEVMRLK